jgi:hypothetical protein
MGMSASLAPRGSGFDSRRLHSARDGRCTDNLERIDMSNLLHEAAGSELALTWELDLDYLTIARFAQLVAERNLQHVARTSWATERMTLEGLFEHASHTLRDSKERAAVLDLTSDLGSECLAHLSLMRGRAFLRVAANSVDTLATARTWLQERYSVVEPDRPQRVHVSFWTNGRYADRTSRGIDAPAWNEISGNYPRAVSGPLSELMTRRFGDKESGGLILWHGPPGTGKTYAVRALAWSWREWCGCHYITDPEAFFGEHAKYMLEVLLDDEGDEDSWRLLILEDTGELLTADAKQRTGQGLSRLLNVADGLLGQGLRVLVLVTTNETLHTLHPAVVRSGRCVSNLEFPAFPADEADAWLEARGASGDGTACTLASLFARAAGRAEPGARVTRHPIGFRVS